ncbi:MAG TPA: response regulator [Terriglobales bacterium]|nr:response regulator [Terriglobales bacterium]
MSIKILLADDSPHAQRDGSRILSELGYEVATASNGSAALKRFEEDLPDLLIADTSMPGLSGLEVCERIKSQPQWARTPVLLALAAFELYDVEQGRRAGADGVIQKPFIPSALEKAVADLLLKAGKTLPNPPREVAAPPAGLEPSAPPEVALTAAASSGDAAPDAAPAEVVSQQPFEPAKPRWQIEEVAISSVPESAEPAAADQPPAAEAEPAWQPSSPAPAAPSTFSPPAPAESQSELPAWHWPSAGWGEPPPVSPSVSPSAFEPQPPAPEAPPPPAPETAAPPAAIAESAAASSVATPEPPPAPPAPALTAPTEPAGDDLLLDALREAVTPPAAPPEPPRVNLAAALAVISEVLNEYLAPMLADEVKENLERRLTALL